jgi:hypothetical protein
MVPKQISSGVCVDSEKQIVLILADFDDTVQISTLKSRLKNNLFMIIECWVHALKGSVVMLIFEETILLHRVLR